MMMRHRRCVIDSIVIVILMSVALFNVLLEPPVLHLAEKGPFRDTSVNYSAATGKKKDPPELTARLVFRNSSSNSIGRDAKAPTGSVPVAARSHASETDARKAKSAESRRRRTVPDVVPGDSLTLEDLEGDEWEIKPPPFDCGCPLTCDVVATSRVNNGTKPFFSSCEMRIRFHMDHKNAEGKFLNEKEACAASVEDGKCGMECHPDRCHDVASDRHRPPPLDWTRVVEVSLENRGTTKEKQKKHGPTNPFIRHEGVVVANKVHSAEDMQKLKQMICLFTAAYNRHVNYDIVVFTTVPWRRWQVEELRSVAPQTNITVVRDSPSLRDQLATLSKDELDFLHKRCSVQDGENLTWSRNCFDPTDYPSWYANESLSYGWQAEFRSYHIWKTKVLAKYKYMIWMDTDAFCTRSWKNDPIQFMIDNDLVLMIDNFPQGEAENPHITRKVRQAFDNRTLCTINLQEEGFHPHECEGPDDTPWIGLVHGFMHITNLDFYRSEPSLRYLELHVGDYRFSREWDDQLAVTVPAAMLAPRRVRDMQMHGYHLGLYHNGDWDGKTRHETYGFNFFEYWIHEGRDQWELGREMCDAVVLFND